MLAWADDVPRLTSTSRAATPTFHTRYLPVSATNKVCSSLLKATPFAKLKPLTTIRVTPLAGSYSRMRPLAFCSRMSSTAASNVPPQRAGAKRPDASLK
jgi:hypothetical protein